MLPRVPESRPWVVLVGGFLGAGKTSLILAAARMLEARGVRCAAILNDQGDELVDTRHAESRGLLAREVTGGCFCCRLSALTSAIEELRTWSPEVIFAEPVGSCTDIAATVIGPLLEEFDRCRLAPFTVLVDPRRLLALGGEEVDADLRFLFEKQIEEADLVVMSKADVFPEAAARGVEARRLSAKTGEGVAEWLDEILGGVLEAGGRIAEVDYARYARAEAALAWLNLSFVYVTTPPMSAPMVAGPLLDGIDTALTAAGIPLVHLKLLDRSEAGWAKAALCANGAAPHVEGHLDASPAGRHEVLVNLRAQGDPRRVRDLVEEQVGKLPGSVAEVRLSCFRPAAPVPERRMVR
ncbi:MAG TPA: GTP-binding protein [Acidobacteriaceae bacterium]